MIETQSGIESYRSQLERVESSPHHAWFNETRKIAMARFGELGIPTTRHEEWHYTNVATLGKQPFGLSTGKRRGRPADIQPWCYSEAVRRLVLVNGQLDDHLTLEKPVPDGVIVCSLTTAFSAHRALLEKHLAQHASYANDAFTALNTALFSDGAFIYVPHGVVVEDPIQILSIAAAEADTVMAHPRHVIIMEANSQATVIETYAALHEGAYFTNAVTEAILGDSANLDHYKMGRESSAAFHIGNLWFQQARSSTATSHTVTFGGRVVRNDITAMLDGEGSHCTLNGLTMLANEQHADNHLRVEHIKPNCTSWEYFKGIYDDTARGVFGGRIYVHKDAQKTDAKQTNMSLLLSDGLADSKPQLEIFADDVKCTHGATIGQVDKNAVFYLQSRGLSAAAARSLLIYAFASETVESVRFEPLRRKLQDEILARLPQGDLMREVS